MEFDSRRIVLPMLLAAGLLLGAGVRPSRAQQPDAPDAIRYPYDFGVSSVPMLRNANAFSAAGELADRGANAALDRMFGPVDARPGRKGVWLRLARLWLVDMPIASLAEGYNHEYGHLLRADWPGTYQMRVTHWPWPVPLSGLEVWKDGNRPFGPFSELSAIAGGVEADFVNQERLLDAFYANDRVSPFDLVLYTYAKAHRTLYILLGDTGDPHNYAECLALYRAGPSGSFESSVDSAYASIRTGGWLNLLDYALVANAERVLVDYVGRGRGVLEPSWLEIGRLRLVPSFNYIFTPRGQHYRLGSRIRLSGGIGNVYIRWTEAVHVGSYSVRLIGAGAEWRSTGQRVFAPSCSLDLWRDADRREGGRAEVAGTFRPTALGARRALRLAVGGKTSGYLPGFADKRGLYVSGGLLVEF